MLSWKHLILAYTISVTAPEIRAQHPFYYNYTTSNGLPSSETYDVIQDRKGFIWVATDRGVSCFDGYSFHNFTTNEGLIDNTVLSLYEDCLGRIWFHGISGRLCYYKDKKIVQYKYNDLLGHGKGNIIRSFQCDKDDNLTIGTIGKGIFRITSDGKIETVYAADRYGRTFIAGVVSGKLLLGISSSNGKIIRPTDATFEFRDGSTYIQRTVKENITSQLNISGLKRKNGSFIFYGMGNIMEVNHERPEMSETGNIVRMFEDSDSCLWVSSSSGGTRRYAPNKDYRDNAFQTYLPDEAVTCIYEDRDKGIWLTTLNSGLFYMPSLDYHTYSYPSRFVLTALCASDKANEVYTGSFNGRIILTGLNGNIRSWILPASADSVNYVYSICSKGDTVLLSSAYWQYFLIGNKLIKTKDQLTYSRSMIVKDGKFYGAGNGNVQCTDPVTGRTRLVISPPGRPDVLYIGNNGKIWLGDHTGLYYVKDAQCIKAFPGVQLLQERISGIAEDGNGNLVVGTIGKGIVLLNNEKILAHIDSRTGLPGNIVNCILVKGKDIWAGTNEGIVRIRREGEKYQVTKFCTDHGLPGNEISKIVFTGNTLWAITKKYLFRFEPNQIQVNENSPPVYIENILLAGSYPDKTDSTRMSYDQFPVRINYVGLAYKKRGAVTYRYRVHGLTETWQFTTVPFVEFLSLPAGNYRFEVEAQNEDGFWSKSPAVYSFSIIPPFWKTWWFVSLCFLSSFTLLVLYFFLRIRSIKRKNEMINTMLAYRQQALVNQMNPHFIFNSLNSIQAFILTEDKRLATRYISKFARLMRLNLDNSRSEFIPLNKEIEAVGLYLELEKLRFKELFSYHVEVDKDIDTKKYLIPAMIIQPYVENCIKHAFHRELSREGIVSLHFSIKNKQLICRIDDNGIGREEAANRKKSDDHRSAGLSITAQRLQLSSAALGQEFYLEIIDKKNENGAAQGTIVIFALPHKLITDD